MALGNINTTASTNGSPEWFQESTKLTPTLFLLHANKLLSDLVDGDDVIAKAMIYIQVLNYYGIDTNDINLTLIELLNSSTSEKQEHRIRDAIDVLEVYNEFLIQVKLDAISRKLGIGFDSELEG